MAIAVAVRGGRPAWANMRTLFGLALFSISLVSGWHLLEGSGGGLRLWAAARDLPAGVPLTASDLVPVTSNLGSAQVPLYLGAEVDLVGAELTRPVRAGEFLAADFVAPSDGGFEGQAITIPVTPEHAVGGALTAGDLVDVYATLRSAGSSPRTALVVEAAQVLDLVGTSDLMADSSTLAGLTLEVSGGDAAKLAHAIRTADLDVVKVNGESSSPVTSVSGNDL